ncbi:MAG: hypothetical protein WD425_08075 [Nitrospirales bacterium]
MPGTIQRWLASLIPIALAGADQDHFHLLDGPPPALEVWPTPNRPAHIELPVVHSGWVSLIELSS